MTPAPPSPASREQLGRRRRLAAFVVCLVVAFLWFGCTVTDENYALLSTLFDGVPDPALVRAAQEEGAVLRGEAVYFQHKPYAEEACDDCHRGAGNVMLFTARDDSSMCLKCHEGVPTQYPYMHGPVASVACRWCHHPHESTVRPLLRAAAPELCLQCHGLDMMNAPQPPEHVDLQRDCRECHFAHGGIDPYLLRPAAIPDLLVPWEEDGESATEGVDGEKDTTDSETNGAIGEEGPASGAP